MGNTYLCTIVDSKDQVIYLNRYNTVSNFCYDKQLMLNRLQCALISMQHYSLLSAQKKTVYVIGAPYLFCLKIKNMNEV